MSAVFQREFKSYFTGFMGYIFAAFMLLFEGIYVIVINLLNGLASFEFTLENIIVVFLLIIPIICMRSISEERQSKTDQLLYSLPIKTSSIVLGKYFALLAVALIPTAIIGIYPIILNFFGNVNLINAYACLFAFYLLAAALISICMFASSLTESPIVAAVLGFSALMVLYLAPMISAIIPTSAIASLICLGILILVVALISYNMTKSSQISLGICIILAIPSIVVYFLKPSLLEGLFPAIMGKLAVFESYMQFIYGIFDVTTIIYYLCIIVFFVFLTVESMEKKRWC
jgi:ABC-2 type transport system permease protein